MKYVVYSPDDIPIKPKPFSSQRAAMKGLDRWIERFKPQGYYKTASGERIPLEQLRARCRGGVR